MRSHARKNSVRDCVTRHFQLVHRKGVWFRRVTPNSYTRQRAFCGKRHSHNTRFSIMLVERKGNVLRHRVARSPRQGRLSATLTDTRLPAVMVKEKVSRRFDHRGALPDRAALINKDCASLSVQHPLHRSSLPNDNAINVRHHYRTCGCASVSTRLKLRGLYSSMCFGMECRM